MYNSAPDLTAFVDWNDFVTNLVLALTGVDGLPGDPTERNVIVPNTLAVGDTFDVDVTFLIDSGIRWDPNLQGFNDGGAIAFFIRQDGLSGVNMFTDGAVTFDTFGGANPPQLTISYTP